MALHPWNATFATVEKLMIQDILPTDTLTSSFSDTVAQVATPLLPKPSISIDDRAVKPFFAGAEKIDTSSFERVSIFEGHALQPVNTQHLPMVDSFHEWFFVLLFGGFVLYAWLFSFNVKRLGHVLGAVFGHRGFTRMAKAGDLFSDPLLFPFMILILLSFSLFGFRIGMEFGLWDMAHSDAINIYGKLVTGVGLLYLIKVIIIKIQAWIFKEQNTAKQYLLTLFVFNTALALGFLPLLLAAFFGDLWLQTGVTYTLFFLFAVWYVWRWIRCFLETKSITKFSYIHNFLYLCTLEIGYYLLIYVLIKIFFSS